MQWPDIYPIYATLIQISCKHSKAFLEKKWKAYLDKFGKPSASYRRLPGHCSLYG